MADKNKSKSPILNVSKDGVAVFAEGQHPRTLRKIAEAKAGFVEETPTISNTPQPKIVNPKVADLKEEVPTTEILEDKNREELNTIALEKGIENPEEFENKKALIKAIEAVK